MDKCHYSCVFYRAEWRYGVQVHTTVLIDSGHVTMTCNTVAIHTVHADVLSFLFALHRFFNTLLETNHGTPCGLPANMAARLYL